MITKVCENCGSERVWKDANARWNAETQSWELLNIFEAEWCDNCDAETTIINKE